jgi:hypothetical protein
MTQGGTYGNTSCGRGHYRSLWVFCYICFVQWIDLLWPKRPGPLCCTTTGVGGCCCTAGVVFCWGGGGACLVCAERVLWVGPARRDYDI